MILAIDTASNFISLALKTNATIYESCFDSTSSHTELLLEAIENIYKTNNILLNQTKLIAISQGPGSFTSLRIGYAVAKGLSLALNCPIISVNTLHFYALSIKNNYVLSTLDARKNRFYVALFKDNERLSDDLDISSDEIVEKFSNYNVVLTGFGAEKLFTSLNHSSFSLDEKYLDGKAKYLSLLAPIYYEKNGADSDMAGPNYVRLSDAELLIGSKNI